MSWLFFMDESGHDHKSMPFEARGGIALHTSKLWNFLQGWQRLERDAFGLRLADYQSEAKGSKLLNKNKLQWAERLQPLPDDERRKKTRIFFEKGLTGARPSWIEFTAYGQACRFMAQGVFDLLQAHDARLFASAIPRRCRPPPGFARQEFLRKDHVYLFERLYYFLESQREHGIIVMDQTEKQLDRKFVDQMESYFTRTATGRNRAYWIIPSPLFVSSEMSHAIQAADICLYCLNWGFRLDYWGADIETRGDISTEFGPKVRRLQWEGDGHRDGQTFRSFGIVYVPNPYEGRV